MHVAGGMVAPMPVPMSHSPLPHQMSDAGSSHSAGSARNVTPPLSIQQGRPLPALPVSPPPPQLPPREIPAAHSGHHQNRANGSNSPWMMPPPARPAAPPPVVTNLDDDWENSSNDSNDLQQRRRAHHRIGGQGDVNELVDAMSGFHPCKFRWHD